MIVLDNPMSNASRKPILPMSLLTLGALLEGRYDYRIIDGNLEADPPESVDRALRETGAQFLGVTMMPRPQLNEVFLVCRDLKRRHPDVTKLWSGYFPTEDHKACLRSGFVAYVVHGHGEVVFRDLLDILAHDGDPRTLNGIAYRSGASGTVAKTLEIVGKMKEYRIVPELSFVLGNPLGPDQDLESTIAFIRNVKRVNTTSEIILFLYTPVPLAGRLFEEWTSRERRESSQRRSTSIPWLRDPLRKEIRDLQYVLNAQYPTSTNLHLSTLSRVILKGISWPRYATGLYTAPVEPRLLQKVVAYQRPETSGF